MLTPSAVEIEKYVNVQKLEKSPVKDSLLRKLPSICP